MSPLPGSLGETRVLLTWRVSRSVVQACSNVATLLCSCAFCHISMLQTSFYVRVLKSEIQVGPCRWFSPTHWILHRRGETKSQIEIKYSCTAFGLIHKELIKGGVLCLRSSGLPMSPGCQEP